MPAKRNTIVRCVVACTNYNLDEPDFIFVAVRVSFNKEGFFSMRRVTAAARRWVVDACNAKPAIVITPKDRAWQAFSKKAFAWKTAYVVDITNSKK